MAPTRDIDRNIDVSRADLPRRLPLLRQQRGLSRFDLAERAGLSEKTIIEIEKGRRERLLEKTLLCLATALGVDMAELLGRPMLPHPAPAVAPPRPRRLRAVVTAVPLLVLTTVVAVLLHPRSGAVRVERSSEGLVARDSRGTVRWRFDAKATIEYVDESPWRDGNVLVGLRGDGSDGGRVLLLAERSGRVIWEIAPEQAPLRAAYGPELIDTGGGFSAFLHEAVEIDGDGETELALAFLHGRFCPACVVFVDRDGHRLGQYGTKGHLYDLLAEDLDGDGREELLAAGTNNEPCYQGATVILLDDVCHGGAAQDSLAGGNRAIPDSARVRLVLPQFGEPYMALLQSRRIEARDLMVFREAGGATRIAASVGTEGVGVVVTLDADLRPLRVQPSDRLISLAATWPDSVTALRGLPDQAWLDRMWLPRGVRFAVGHWGRRGAASVD